MMPEAEGNTDPKPPIAARAARTVKTLRWWVVLPLPLLVIAINSFGPDGWREPLTRLVWLSWVCVIVAAAHGFRKALFSYADLGDAWDKAQESATGAGIAFLGVCLVLAALLMVVSSTAKAQDVRTYVPQNARVLLPELKAVQAAYWPDFPMPSYFGALIEQESCISLTHSRCWNSRAQLKTAREEGAGLGQFTRAYTESGALRFDAIAEVRALDPKGLREFTWASVYSRADLSMRAILVKFKDCFRRLEQQTRALPAELIAFCDAAYNGGLGGLLQDRRLCDLDAACDPLRWFGHVERFSAKSRQKWQGYGKSAFAINREHVENALVWRRPKYIAALGADLI
jgi:hypothetical protein